MERNTRLRPVNGAESPATCQFAGGPRLQPALSLAERQLIRQRKGEGLRYIFEGQGLVEPAIVGRKYPLLSNPISACLVVVRIGDQLRNGVGPQHPESRREAVLQLELA